MCTSRRILTLLFLASTVTVCVACDIGDSPSDDNKQNESPSDIGTDDDSETEPDTGIDTETDTHSNEVNDFGIKIDAKEAKGCERVTVTKAELSPKISTVGIIEWEADGKVDDAYIEFGPLDGDYQWQAPVDLNEEGYRTLLIGMKTNTKYKYRVVATIDDESCVGGAHGILTANLPTGIPLLTQEGKSSGGFLVTTSFVASFGPTASWDGAIILDEDGDYVWWYNPDSFSVDWVRARISYDGKYMWLANGNYPDMRQGKILKIAMDGTSEEVFNYPNRHHDLLTLPFDDIVTFMEYEKVGTSVCDQIVERAADGTTSVVFTVRDHFPDREESGEWCHSNALNYVESEDAYYLSVLLQNMIVKFNRSTGELVWTMGGEDTDFPGIWWEVQHQHHVLEDSILIFNNYGGATDDRVVSEEDGAAAGGFLKDAIAHIVEYKFDEDTMEAELIWDYTDGTMGSMAMGDTKRLPNGNTQIVYSSSGVIQEVTPDMEKVYEIRRNGSFGYANRRDSLYTLPPEYDYYPTR